MKFTKPLIKGKLIKRYKRFFTDVNIDGVKVTAHCPNTGSMKGLLDEGNEVHLLKHCLLYTSPSPRDRQKSRMPSSA